MGIYHQSAVRQNAVNNYRLSKLPSSAILVATFSLRVGFKCRNFVPLGSSAALSSLLLELRHKSLTLGIVGIMVTPMGPATGAT